MATARKRRTGHGSPGSPFRSLLVPLDFAPGWRRVLDRVALLPLTANARVTLLHVVSRLLPARVRDRVKAHTAGSLVEAARLLEEKLGAGVRVTPTLKVGFAASVVADQARAVGAELIVMGRGGGRVVRDEVLGSTAERVLRQARLPVLVVRLAPRSTYQRPVLAIDFDEAALNLLRSLFRILPSPRPRVRIVHAHPDPYDPAHYPASFRRELDAYRAGYEEKARAGLAKLLAQALLELRDAAPDDPGLDSTIEIRHGDPRAEIGRAVAKRRADLLVLGTRGHFGPAQPILGTVAGDLLRTVACDVLVVPPAGA